MKIGGTSSLPGQVSMLRIAIALSLFAAAACKDKVKGGVPASNQQAAQSGQAPAPPPAGKPAHAAPDQHLEAPIGGSNGFSGLALTIDAAYEHEKPLDKAPWHGAGGDWTFLDLRTPGGARFTVGVGNRKASNEASFVFCEAMLVGADRAQGDAVVSELATGLGVSPPAREKGGPLSPMHLTSVELGTSVARSPEGGFSGDGSWTASKWTFETEEDAAEVFFNYSLADKRAELTTKDEEYNSSIVASFAAALRDGQRK